MSEDLQRIIGDVLARLADLERRNSKNESMIQRGVFGLIGLLGAVAYAHFKSKGLLP